MNSGKLTKLRFELRKTHKVQKLEHRVIGDGKPSLIGKTAVIETLRKIGGEKTVYALYKTLSQKILMNWMDRVQAIYTIGDLAGNDERVIELLLTLRKEDEDGNVQIAAIGALGNIQLGLTRTEQEMPIPLQTKVISHLHRLLVGETKHFDGEIRWVAVRTLRDFKCDKSIAILKQVLVDDEDEDVKKLSRNVLANQLSVISYQKIHQSVVLVISYQFLVG